MAIAPVLAFFDARMLLHRMDASRTPDEVRDAIARTVGLPASPSAPPPAPEIRNVRAMEAMAAAYGYRVEPDGD